VGSPAHKDLYESFIGALFFGVPNRGLNDKFLHEIVRGQPNQYLIQSLDPESSELRRLHEGFTTIFDKTKYQFYSYYETCVTALSEVSGPHLRRVERLCRDRYADFVTVAVAVRSIPLPKGWKRP